MGPTGLELSRPLFSKAALRWQAARHRAAGASGNDLPAEPEDGFDVDPEAPHNHNIDED